MLDLLISGGESSDYGDFDVYMSCVWINGDITMERINKELLDSVSEKAKVSPRLRMNYNFI